MAQNVNGVEIHFLVGGLLFETARLSPTPTTLSSVPLKLRAVLTRPHDGNYLGDCQMKVVGVVHDPVGDGQPGPQTVFLAIADEPLEFGDSRTDRILIWARGRDFLDANGGIVRFIGQGHNAQSIGYISPEDPNNHALLEGRFQPADAPGGTGMGGLSFWVDVLTHGVLTGQHLLTIESVDKIGERQFTLRALAEPPVRFREEQVERVVVRVAEVESISEAKGELCYTGDPGDTFAGQLSPMDDPDGEAITCVLTPTTLGSPPRESTS